MSQDDLADIFHVSRDEAYLRQANQLDEMNNSKRNVQATEADVRTGVHGSGGVYRKRVET